MSSMMEAIVIPKFGGPEVLEFQQVSKPEPAVGEVLISVKAFGINHAEMHMRKGEWDEWNPITGLECVGIVEACPGNEIPVGSKVIALMGGMGRERPGSYDLKAGESILIRGATSTIGQGAVNLAVNAGAKVTGTTRREGRFKMLKDMGVMNVVLEHDNLASEFPDGTMFDKVLNLIGNRVLVESIEFTRADGRMLQAGWLGGLAPVKDFNPMVEMKPGVHFSLFHSKVLGTAEFPLSGVPLQDIVDKIEAKAWVAKPTYVFDWKDIRKAHELLDSHNAGGKIVAIH
ncbi:hypothetical protein LTS17_006180 [Exophiala oligosperma]